MRFYGRDSGDQKTLESFILYGEVPGNYHPSDEKVKTF